MNKRELRQAERDFWGSLMISQKPEFWLTFDFLRPYSDRVSIGAMKFGMRAIQRKVPSRRTLRGVASIERTWKNVRYDGCLHFHGLLWGFDGNVRDPDTYAYELVHKSLTRLTDDKGRPMVDASTIDLQRVYEPERVADYATKDIMKGDAGRSSRQWLIRPDGLDTSTGSFD